MNNDNCKAVFSEFSGGGQLSQYTHKKKIFYIETIYTIYRGHNIISLFEEANQPNNLYDRFDLKLFTTPSIYIFKDIYEFINNFKDYYFDIDVKIIRI